MFPHIVPHPNLSVHARYMEVAFYSERSIEDELARETSGDIKTIAVSYIIMFIYITFALGMDISLWTIIAVNSLLMFWHGYISKDYLSLISMDNQS